MTRDLLILRHAHTKNNHSDGDFYRELKNKGKRNAQRMGVWLQENQLQPELVLSSPAERARTTAHKCCKSAGLSKDIVQTVPRLYNGAPIDLRGAIGQTHPDVKRLMVVAHNPGLSMLVGQLSNNHLSISPGTLVHLQFDGSWNDIDMCVCRHIVEPTSLPEYFPFPGPNGIEQRIRPAYYYRQSCVIPFRIKDGDINVLLVSSSSGKHWVVPKGIHDPGLSAQESALEEAREEAGVLGHTLDAPLGQYEYEKWEATCNVTAFPMIVEQELDASQWEESHRLRKWVSLEAAVELVKNPELSRIIALLPAYMKENGHV